MVILGLQSRLWFGEGSLAEVWQLRQDVAKKKQENAALLARNQRLAAEVSDLKQGTEALEGRARSQLGMIKEGETFYLILDK